MNLRHLRNIRGLYYDLAKALRRAARAVRISEKVNGLFHPTTIKLRHRAEAYASAKLAARDEKQEAR